MLSEHEVRQKLATAQSITMDSFNAKNNIVYYERRDEFEIRQFLAEFSQGILNIVLGDDALTLTELIEGQTQLIINKD